MRGKRVFTEQEANEIKELIQLKVQAPKNKQKSIRDKIRKIGFYYLDFRKNRIVGGYTVQDFNGLIDLGEIVIVR